MAPPQHIAIIMDGNRRWAQQNGLPAALGHAAGARRVRGIVEACKDRGVRFLTLFAFSTENWRRPPHEVSGLMDLLAFYLKKEVKHMKEKGVRLKVAGALGAFDARLQDLMRSAQEDTSGNDELTLTIAANYGGRADVVQAVKSWQAMHPNESVADLDENALTAHLGLSYAPDPDLLIRTGAESRVSNFMLWQLAYTEMYFTDELWPGFSPQALDQAIAWYGQRERRFGGS
ncbi:MAG: polyprenyl diphosphate synthase [Betaproteobacteria bacterium]